MSSADTSNSPRNDNTAPPQSGNLGADMIMALRFYSRLPSGSTPHERPDLKRIAMAVPFAGLVIGIGPAALLFLATIGGVPPLFSVFVALAGFAAVTGAMSEDAIADAADGLFGGATRERRLEILKDSRHGTYGVLAIVFIIGLKAAALSAIAARNPLAAMLVWLAAGLLARSAALYLPLVLGQARAEGAAATVGGLTRNAFAGGTIFATLIAFVLAAPFVGVLGFVIALVLGLLVLLGWTRLCDRLVGGVTGDLIGAAQALVEIVVLATFMRMIVT
ncbi:adenosylcobinamide-GDP ribazoletransferase [Pelagibacterium xiamenense]|uniref:adenosylcobinamide-GDP ribazoletransferase n=1 Tax=Pelagibacterium xiamenense TaxID=2901140 RepID=UPI001E5DFE5F|nr:adenosylcobinamide-GDP ribazoletransferase [Pelagibacterium xiamenense]MCD7059593.1 adenosylcobinamide-GDP ribazoletransferase [Pelagibacterium xiamenense]